MKPSFHLFIALAILLGAATVTAQVYKWVDKDGKVQYTDTPPPLDAKGVPKKIDARPAAGAGSAATKAPPTSTAKGVVPADAKTAPPDKPKTLAELNMESEKRRTDALDAEKKAAAQSKMDKANQDRCKEATRYFRDLETGRPISITDDAGQRKLLDDPARATELARAQNAMNESCK